MQERLKRVAIAATLLGTLLVPAAGSVADPDGTKKLEKKLEANQAQKERLGQKIERDEAKARWLQAKVARLDGQIRTLREILTTLDERIEEHMAHMRSVQAEVDATQAQIDEVRDAAIEQAVTLYKSGATETLDALLNAESLAELDDRVQMLGVAAQENTNALVRYGRLRAEIQDQHRELFEIKQALSEKRSEYAAQESDLDRLYDQHAVALAKLEKKLEDEHEDYEKLEAGEAKLERDLLSAYTLDSVAKLGKSDEGYIWPMNGSVTSYYGYRWGRMHSGIDIDCNTGDPLVSSKAGRVILARVYGGYGNTIGIAHARGFSTVYAHLNAFDVSEGQDVRQGEVIARCGSTGNSTGSHLHFEVRVNSQPRDPLDYLP